MSSVVGLECDRCHRRTTHLHRFGAVSFKTERKWWSGYGWHTKRGLLIREGDSPLGYVRDICPECWDQGLR